ncbi:MAG: NAD(P)-dependent oxidoreductase [Deltaproteobacteria bacterium]|nr:NAD(P)-dependent oxidoreductase [Deltaproteobacteria bacterium]
MNQKIGVIGLGIMGSAISANLIKSGFEVIGYDIRPECLETLKDRGGSSATCVREIAEAAEIVITSLPSVAALQKVVSGPDGLLTAAKTGLIVVEVSTFPIEAKQEAFDLLKKKGTVMLDCPLSGTGAQAVSKDLAVYASGDRQLCENCRPVFDGFARANYYIGKFGTGSRMKFIANLLVAIHNVASAEAFVLGMKAGLDAELIYKVISDGAGTSRMFEVRGPMMTAGEYDEATMKVGVFQKDLDIITAFAKTLQCPTPLLSTSCQIYTQALAGGRSQQDTASVCAVLENMANLNRS